MAGRAVEPATREWSIYMAIMRKHRVLGSIAGLLALASLCSCALRLLPVDLQTLPYVSVVLAATPWFAIVSVVSLVLALISTRWVTVIVAGVCLVIQVCWQLPFYHNGTPLSGSALSSQSLPRADTADAVARLMTCNVYKGHADATAIVNAVRDNHVEVLALQETTPDFLKHLEAAGISQLLPYSQTSSADGYFGNALFSALPFENPSQTDVDSIASYMPGGTVGFDNGAIPVRFVSVHTQSPTDGRFEKWSRSIAELKQLNEHPDTDYILMGDFNSTWDHAVFRDMLGTRFQDAAEVSGHGLVFTWPADRKYLPAFAGIDHIVTSKGMTIGQVNSLTIPGSDHRALLATVDVSGLRR